MNLNSILIALARYTLFEVVKDNKVSIEIENESFKRVQILT
jgi:hypothetical protein